MRTVYEGPEDVADLETEHHAVCWVCGYWFHPDSECCPLIKDAYEAAHEDES